MDPVTGAILGGVISGGASLGGDFLSNSAASNAASAATHDTIRMMKKRHYWEVQDLKRAGLNPILSAGGTPSSGSAPMANMPGYGDLGVSSGLDAAKSVYDIGTKGQQKELLDNQVEKSKADAQTAVNSAKLLDAELVQKNAEVQSLYGSDSGKRWTPWLKQFGISAESLAAGKLLGIDKESTSAKTATGGISVSKPNSGKKNAEEVKALGDSWKDVIIQTRPEKKDDYVGNRLDTATDAEIRAAAEEALKEVKERYN